jgi:hypothetical protein
MQAYTSNKDVPVLARLSSLVNSNPPHVTSAYQYSYSWFNILSKLSIFVPLLLFIFPLPSRSFIPNLIRITLPDLHLPQGLHHLILHVSELVLNVLQLPQFLFLFPGVSN